MLGKAWTLSWADLLGCSRQQFHEIRRNFQTYGTDGLIDRLPDVKEKHIGSGRGT